MKVAQSCPSLVQGILQARILEWVAVPFSRGSSQPRDWTQVTHIAGGFFTSWATRKALWSGQHNSKNWPQENGEKNWPWSWRLTGLETIKMALTQPATWLQLTLAHNTSLFQGGWDWFTNLLSWISSGSRSMLEGILKLEFYLLVKGIIIGMMSLCKMIT